MRLAQLLLVLTACDFSLVAPAGSGDAGPGTADARSDGAPAIDASIDGPVDAPQLACATNPAYQHAFGGSTYRLATTTTLLAFDPAVAQCQADGARLAVIETMAENEHLAARVLNFPDWSWIGLTDRTLEGTQVWVNGLPLLPTDYRPFNGEIADGTADCYNMSPSQISGQNGRWGNYYCDQAKGWICECDTTP